MNKKLSALTSAALLAAGSMVAGVPDEKPRKPRKPAKRKGFPGRAELRAMPKEKRDYWTARMTGNAGIKTRVAQYLAARNPAENPEPITRQVRRHLDRVADKMPLEASQAKWHAYKGFGKIGPGKPRRLSV